MLRAAQHVAGMVVSTRQEIATPNAWDAASKANVLSLSNIEVPEAFTGRAGRQDVLLLLSRVQNRVRSRLSPLHRDRLRTWAESRGSA